MSALAPTSPRVWGRVSNDGTPYVPGSGKPYTWVPVTPAANGSMTAIYVTWLIQTLLLNLGESPIYSDWGIPGEQSVVQQIIPDFYVNEVQKRFAQYFASLLITRRQPSPDIPNPYYDVSLVTLEGQKINETVVPV